MKRTSSTSDCDAVRAPIGEQPTVIKPPTVGLLGVADRSPKLGRLPPRIVLQKWWLITIFYSRKNSSLKLCLDNFSGTFRSSKIEMVGVHSKTDWRASRWRWWRSNQRWLCPPFRPPKLGKNHYCRKGSNNFKWQWRRGGSERDSQNLKGGPSRGGTRLGAAGSKFRWC